MRRGFLILVLLSACSGSPELPGAPVASRTDGPWPALLSVSGIVEGEIAATNAAGSTSETEAEALARRAAALRARAAVLRRDAETDAQMQSLRARMAEF